MPRHPASPRWSAARRGACLARPSQARLWADLQASRTGLKRLRAGVPGAVLADAMRQLVKAWA